jgi:hypothetical protein
VNSIRAFSGEGMLSANQEKIQEHILGTMSQLGRASKIENGYFRTQKNLGPESKAKTVFAVYFRDVGQNLLEFAFDVDAVASSLDKNRSAVQSWLQVMRDSTSEEIHQNQRFAYYRIGILDTKQLDSFLGSWKSFCNEFLTPDIKLQTDTDFVSVPFYVEENGDKTLFMPELKSPTGYRIGPKGNEIVMSGYWEALLMLCQMTPPRFRRKNHAGNPGIVTCQVGDVLEVKKNHLEKLLNEIE